MIKQMTKYSFVIFHKDVASFLENLQKIGLLDIRRTSKPASKASYELLEKISAYRSAQKILHQIQKKAGGNTKLPEQTTMLAEEVVSKTEHLSNEIRSLNSEIAKLEVEYKNVLPWGDFQKDSIQKIRDLGLTPCFVVTPTKKFDESLKEKYALQVISSNSESTYFVVLLSENERLKGKLKVVEPPIVSASEINNNLIAKKKERQEKENEILALTAGLDSLSKQIKALEAEIDLLFAGESSKKAAENTIEIFTGFAPTENKNRICSALDTLSGSIYYIAEEAKTEDNPPIALRNNWFTRMFAPLTDMYGRPAYNEFDPTPYISVFFMLFFAMCMGDAGYGILLTIIGLFMKRVKGAAKFAPLVLTLGIATIIVGFLLHTFFGIDISQVSWIPHAAKKIMITGTIAGYDAQMVLSLAIGVLHICIAMLVKSIYSIKKNGFANSLGTIGWTLLIVGGVVVGAVALLANLDSGIVKIIVIVLGIVSAIGIFFLNDLHRNPLKNIGSGLWETYNTVTGLLGDVLSYIRLYALGLAGGMLGAAFNNLAGMLVEGTSGFSVMWVFFVLIVVLGHVLNLAMCCLGAFVHPLRLNFLEFFKNSGYEGSGKAYNPLTINNN